MRAGCVFWIFVGSWLWLVLPPLRAAEALPERIEFNRDIRPLLAENCFACHGPDKNKREADLRLDTQAGLVGDEQAVGAVKPGSLDESSLWQRVVADDPEARMPPAASGKQLSAGDLALLRRWIEQGAPWEGHWAFNPIRRLGVAPAPSTDAPPADLAGRIDALIEQSLSDRQMPMSPEADRRTLVRRLSLDLNGLPPTGDEVEAFARDLRPDAYELLVDRLLASPRFGERLAMWWLDLVRYADSVGYHGDQAISVFAFREYVIDAFNANKPFDQFTIEQLGGDLLPEPTTEQLVASGYNRLGMMSAEGGVQPKEYLAKYIAERVRNVGGAWLGVTLGCCECHDHKYDPFTMRDFYGLEAFFADIEERGLYDGASQTGNFGPTIKVPTPEQSAQRESLQGEIGRVQRVIATPTPELTQAQSEWEGSLARWRVLRPSQSQSAGGATLEARDDGSLLVGGERPAKDTTTLTFGDLPAGTTLLRLDVIPDDSLPAKGPGRAGNGNFVLTEISARYRAAPDAESTPVKLSTATASFAQTKHGEDTPNGHWAASDAIDGHSEGGHGGWAMLEQVGSAQVALFGFAEPLPGGAGSELVIELAQQHGDHHTLGRFRLSASTDPRPIRAENEPRYPANDLLLAEPAERTAEQTEEIARFFRTQTPLLAAERAELARLENDLRALETSIATTLVTRTVAPRMVRVLSRGNWMDDSGEELQPATPAVLPPLPALEQRPNRLDLARWLVAPENPLTARATANRLWKLLFGAGLSRRLDDLGAQGQWPSHPELLDALAAEFIDSGWDLKRLLKQIVMTRAYRRSSVASDAARELDPDNLWLARQSPFRLDAELVRDNALAIGGLLIERQGGPSAKPYQPKGYWSHLNFPTREWQSSVGPELYRRGLYTHWQRQYLHPALLAFDAPSREECTADRPRSNTPLQSLVLLNDPQYVEAARGLAERMLRLPETSPAARIDWAFRQAVARAARPEEIELLAALAESHRAQYAASAGEADQTLTHGEHPAPADLDRAALAAWTNVARVVLNLHETITRN